MSQILKPDGGERFIRGNCLAAQTFLGRLHSHRNLVLYFSILTITLHMALAEP